MFSIFARGKKELVLHMSKHGGEIVSEKISEAGYRIY